MSHLIRFLLLLLLPAYLSAVESHVPIVGFDRLYELTGPEEKPMVMPTDIAVNTNGRVYIVDSGNNRILCYSDKGEYLFAFGTAGEGEGQLLGPVGITTAKDGSVLVADRGNRRIQVFDDTGKYLTSIPTKTEEKTMIPVDVAVDTENKYVYVTASKPHHQVLVYSGEGGQPKIKSIWGKPGSNLGEFRFPATIAVGPEDNLYIVDVFNSRVQILNRSGAPLVSVGSWGITPGHLFRPKGIAVSQEGAIAISDSYLGVIQLFDDDKRFQAVLGENDDFAHFNTPTGMAFDGHGRLYVAEMLSNKVTVLEVRR